MNPTELKKELFIILQESCPGIDFENESSLVDDEIIDSMDVVTIVSEIAGTFEVELNVEDIIPDNFNSVEGMINLIRRRMN